MASIKSKLVIFAIKNRHFLEGRLTPEKIDFNTSTVELRKKYEKAAKKFGSIPKGIAITPINIPAIGQNINAEWIYPASHSPYPSAEEKAIFYTHGGGYVSGNCEDHRMHVAKFVKSSGVGALLYDYRLAPEYPFPVAIEDTLIAYRWLLAQGVKAENIVFAGESAGGGLCLASLLAIRDEGLNLPAAGVALSPWTDLTCSGNSYRINAKKDISTLGSWDVWSKYYIGDNDPTHPWISPLYGDLQGLPPLLIQVGDHEILLDDARGFAAKAKAAGVEVTLHVWEGMVHCFPLLAPAFPEATQAWNETIEYIRTIIKVN